MGEQTPELQFERFVNLLLTLPGMLAMLGLIVAAVLVFSNENAKWWLFTALLLFAPMFISGADVFAHTPAITPFQQFRVYGRPICVTLLILMLIPTVAAHRGWRLQVISGSIVVYLIFEMIISARYVVGGSALRGLAGAGIFLINFLVLGIGLSKWLQNLGSVRNLLRCVAMASLVQVVFTLVQLAVNPRAIIAQDRLYGLTSNPQQMALVVAASLHVTAFLAVWKHELKSLRMVWACLAGLLVILLIWTGSRTGAMVALLGIGLLFRRHLGRFLALALVCSILVLVGMQIWSDVGEPGSRLLSGVDTRTAVWSRMLADFLSNPAVGVPEREAVGSENSYLIVAARFGLVGLIPLAALLAWITGDLIRLIRLRKQVREESLLVDLVFAGLLSLLAGAFFEGYLIGTISHQVMLIYCYLVVTQFLRDAADVEMVEVLPERDSSQVPYEIPDIPVRSYV